MALAARCAVILFVIQLPIADRQIPTANWTVYLHRVGPLTIGATISETRRILGDPDARLVQALHQDRTLPLEPDDSPCAYLVSLKLPEQLGLMFQRERLARVDVSKSGIKTASGAQVGDPESQILRLYGT